MSSGYPGSIDAFATNHVDSVGEVIEAADINDLADAVNKIEGELGTNPSASFSTVTARLAVVGQVTIVRRASGTENITNNTLTSATWDTETQDDGSWFVIGTPDRITVSATGVYMIVAHVAWDSSVTGDRYMHLERIRASDGVQEVLDANAVKATIVSEQEQTCVAVTPLTASDALRVKLFQNSGTTRTWGGQGRSSGNPVASSTVSEFTVIRLI